MTGKFVPALDLAAEHASIKDELLAAVGQVLDHGQFILGPEVAALEKDLASRLGVGHVVGVGNGTDALVLALRVKGIGPGHEVLTVSHSFFATASAIALVGATPVFVDVHPDTLTMDPASLERALTPKTRAIMPVHLMGSPADMEPIVAFAKAHNLVVIEDVAQAFGATVAGRAAGSFGVGAFSLHPLKVLSACGDGGFISTDDSAEAEHLRILRNLGMRERGVAAELSGNSRLDTLHAAMLLVKMRHFDQWNIRRRSHAAAYDAGLRGAFDLVTMPGDGKSVYSVYVIRSPHRDKLVADMGAAGFDLKVHYPLAIHQQPAFRHLATTLPVTERIVNEIVSLPVAPGLDDGDRNRLIDALVHWRRTHG